MSYKDANGEWQAGQPPADLNLADSHPRQAVPAKWCTEKQVETVLGLSIEQIYRDPELVGAAQVVNNEVMFDATVVVERAYQAQQSRQSVDTGSEDAEEVSLRADDVLAAMREQGLELGPFGGDAA